MACVAEELTATLPNATLAALMLNVGTEAFNVRLKLLALLVVLAVSVAVCLAVTDVTLAANTTLVAPLGTMTDAGTDTIFVLLANATDMPVLEAALFRVTVQESVPAPVIALDVQLNCFTCGTALACSLTFF